MFYRNVATVTNTATNKGDNKLNILEYSNQFNQSINQSINGISIAPPTKYGRRCLTM